MGLYTFSKKSWHVRFFKWLFNEDPTRRYKTMCPYFWTYVLVILLLPLILFIKMFGKLGTKFLVWAKNYSNERDDKLREKFSLKAENPNITQREAYLLVKSKCWDNYSYTIGWDTREKLCEMFWDEERIIDNRKKAKKRLKAENRREFNQRIENMKEYKYYNVLSFIMSGIIILFGLYFLYMLFSLIPITASEWLYGILFIITTVGISAGVIFGIYYLVKYVFQPIITWISCYDSSNCGFCNNVKTFFSYFVVLKYIFYPFYYVIIGIIKLFRIIGHMIYSTYKKQCPLITWKD